MAQTYTFNRSQADDIIQSPVSKIKHNGTTYEIKDATARATLATKQDTLSTQTAYTSKGSATKVPRITTNTLGQVTSITEVTITQPTVNNSTITIQKNSTTVDSFTLNQSTDKTINISVPTTAADVGAVPTSRTINSKALSSDITLTASDVGAISSHQSIKTLKTDNTSAQSTSSSEAIAGSGTINLHKVSKTGSYNDLLNKPTIPATNVIPATTTANKVLVSTTTSGTAKWSDFSSAGLLKTNTSGVVSVDTTSYGTYSKPSGGIPSTDLAESYYLASNPDGYTSNTGTVTSVRVQAGTGLSSSTSTAQSTTLNTTISVASGYKLPTTTEWNGKQDALPTQSGNSGKFLTTNGSAMSWADASVEIDNSTITKNGSNQIQTVGVKDSRSSNTIKTWTGTRAQYDAIVTKDPNTLYNITDDTDTTAAMLELLYPVGAVYIGTMDVCPLASLGIGSWEKIAEDQVLQGSSSNHNAGATIAAGLPNITGQTAYTYLYDTSNVGNGAFSWNTNGGGVQQGTSSNTGSGVGTFNAHNSNSIYGNSNTVQPPAFVVNIWRRIS